MSFQSSFQDMFDKFLSVLKSSNKVLEVSKNFGPDKRLLEMFSFLWELEEAKQFLEINLVVKNKNDDISEQFRKEGNKFYQNKDLPKALELYNKSIIYSPQLNVNNAEINLDGNSSTSSEISSRNLAYGYANRSAVLFELGNYEGCLTDISRSIQYGYPAILRPKLVERQAKCYLAQHNNSKAQEVLNECLSNLNSLGLEECNLSQAKSNLKFVLKQSNNIKENCNKNPIEVHSKYKSFTRIELPKIPSLEESNAQIPSLSKAVNQSFAPEKGRFLVANRDIMPGEILIKETGFSCIVLPPSLLSHCTYCLQRTITPVPCPKCISVIFCSEDCYTNALSKFHCTECLLLPSLVSLDMGKNAMVAFRLAVQLTLSKSKEEITDYLKELEDNSEGIASSSDKTIYSSNDYKTIYNLVTNHQSRTVSDLFKRCSMAFCLVKLLENANGHLRDNDNNGNNEAKQNIFIIGKVIFNHLMNLPCNAHSITELAVNTLKYQESYMEEVGAGAFSVLSLTNHSCNPTLARSCYGSTIVARAIQFIPKGSEVTDSYGEHYAIQSTEERQNCLRQQYYFVCSCEACSQHWPVYSSLSTDFFLKCPNCVSSLDIKKAKCPGCLSIVADLFSDYKDAPIDLNSLYKEIKISVAKFNTSYENVLNGNITTEDYQNIINVIYMLGKYVSLPNKTMFEAQETIKHCYDREGSHYYLQL